MKLYTVYANEDTIFNSNWKNVDRIIVQARVHRWASDRNIFPIKLDGRTGYTAGDVLLIKFEFGNAITVSEI